MTPRSRRPYAWFTEERLNFALKILLALVLVLYLLSYVFAVLVRLQAIVFLLVGAIFFAYLIYPVVRWLNRRVPLWLSIVLVYLALVGIVVAGLIVVVPALASDVTLLTKQYPHLLQVFSQYVNDPRNPLLQRSPQFVRAELVKLPDQIVAWIRVHGFAAASHALDVVLGTVATLATFVIIPVLAAYLLLDSEHLKRMVVGIIPQDRRDGTLVVLGELEGVIGGFIRGQLLVGGSIGVIIAVPLMILHIPYAILIGAVAAILDLIPYVGPVMAFVPAFLIALFNNGPAAAVWVLVIFVAANQIEGHLIAPNVVSRTIELRPLAIILAILVGGEIGGLLGMFVAVPIAGMLRVLAAHIFPPKASVEEAKPALTGPPREEVEGVEQAEPKPTSP